MNNELPVLAPPETLSPKIPESNEPSPPKQKGRKGSAFWLSIISLLLSCFLCALDVTAVGTMLPTISNDLGGTDNFAWIGTAYMLAATVFLPLSGNLADIFGRRSILMLFVAIFALGSALAGSAQSMNWLIAARTVQGTGSGGIGTIADIIISDLVPLSERGLYQGLFAVVWAFASAVGPIIGGSLAERASWRWLFYMNLPISGIAIGFVFVFLRVRTPPGAIKSKLAAVDWSGNVIVIAGATLCNIGLSWAGVRYAWSDVHVLAPLIVGFALIIIFVIHQRYIASQPTVPGDVVGNGTTFSAFLGTFIHGITSIALIYYLPVYFQAVLGASPIASGVDILPTSLLIAPMALASGLYTQVFQSYVPCNYVGWITTVAGFGVLSLMKADSSHAQWIGYQFVVATGIGLLFASTVFPALAPLPLERAAASLALLAFIRSFAQSWGITITATILQNELKRSLPAEFISEFPSGVEIAFAIINQIPSLPEPLQSEVKVAFANSMSTIWKTMVGIAGIGLLSVFLMKEIPLPDVVNATYALTENSAPNDAENHPEAEK
ncbi:major facilitator superfamily domain-containing protein [Flagelloscypha sp. PMI_526]|nr:major facilitator superfamily domain-containing protein [Flagelloscypha sp. PMI_526]